MIGNDRYLVEVSDLTSEVSTKKFNVFRNYDMINDNIIDSDLYFVDKDIDPSDIIWPESSLSTLPLMSDSPKTFNSSFDETNFFEESSILIDDELYEKNVKTIKLKIWHPTTSIRRDMVVYCDSWVNSVHYHWICKKMSSLKYDVGKEVKINQDIYNEYSEIEIPDPNDILFSSTFIKNNSFIKENEYSKEKVKYVKEHKATYSLHSNNEYPIYDECDEGNKDGSTQLIDLHLLTQQWKYVNEYEREYINDGIIQFGSIGINVTLYPWTKIDENDTYVIDQQARPSSCRFSNEMKFSISPSLEFIDGRISIVGRFNYPIIFDCIGTAWETINSTDFSKYESLSEKAKDDEDAMELLGGNPSMVKYQCIIGSDNSLKYIIHNETAYDNKVDDFSFPLKDLFDDWTQVPNAVFIKVMVEDRAIGKGCSSPIMMITKEKLKYVINKQRYDRLSIKDKQTNIDDMNKENFNFISNLNCRIVRNAKANSDTISKQQNSPRIIYKPVFFKVQDLQNITLRSNLNQNIGISLSSYVNKIDEFVLKIGENNFYEVGRTGSFVLFNINANSIEDSNGKYDILSVDDNLYISSGKYTIE